tara:strand:+ start:2715 stop:3488 length:774 start_codon:yes stop_codon:yes gene_type:complete
MALDANTQAVLRDIIDGLVDNNKMFSGYHVALIASDERGCGVPRRIMKEEAHTYYDEGGLGNEYTRTWQQDPQGVSYYVYHNSNDDPRLYEPLDRNAGPELKLDKTVAPAPVAAPVVVDPAIGAFVDPIDDADDDESEEDDDDEVNNGAAQPNAPAYQKTTDRWGRIRVPSRALTDVGIASGDAVYLGIDTLGNSLVIAKRQLAPQDSPSGQFSRVYNYRTDRYCNIRIGKDRLSKAGIQGNSVDIEIQNADRVVIS